MLLPVLLWAMVMPVRAHEVPDLTCWGSITVTIRCGSNVIAGGEMTLHRAGDIHEDDGNYSFILTDEFEDSRISLEKPQSAETAKKLASYASAEKIEGQIQKIGTDAVTVFSDLEPGLYLLVQSKAAKGYKPAEPFLVTLPMLVGETYHYHVDAGPKVSPVEKEEDPNPEQPKTGQSSLPMWMFSLSAIGLLILTRKRDRES